MKKIKCVIWDLDETVWNGVLLEGNQVQLKDEILEIIKEFDRRGILQSIASKNNHETAIEKLKEFNISEYFLYPQINWNNKSSSIKIIADELNLGIDSFAFIDDQIFEREEVNFSLPEVLCIDPKDLRDYIDQEIFKPKFITEETSKRRAMYQSEAKRKNIERNFQGTKEEFLASLNMVFTIKALQEEDLKRAEDLTIRTNQLNTTGYTYTYDELNYFRKSDKHIVLSTKLKDKYGSYGTIGFALIEILDDVWRIKVLLMSCRVMSRGVGSVLLNYIMHLAKEKGVRLQADFVRTDRNRMMYITYKFAGFKEIKHSINGTSLLETNFKNIQSFPKYINLVLDDELQKVGVNK